MEELKIINKKIDNMAKAYYLDLADLELIDKKAKVIVKSKLKSLEYKGLSDIQSKAYNNILNYSVDNKIKIEVSNGINYLEEYEDIEINNQINVLFRENQRNFFVFFFDTGDDLIQFSSIIEFSDMNKKIYNCLNKEFKQLKDNLFRNLMYCEDDNTIHVYGKLDFDEITDFTLDKLNRFLNGAFIDKLIKLSNMAKEEIYKELDIK